MQESNLDNVRPVEETIVYSSFACALSDETCCNCRKLDLKAEKYKIQLAAIQKAISFEIVIFWCNYATEVSNTSIHMFSGILNAMEYSKSDTELWIYK